MSEATDQPKPFISKAEVIKIMDFLKEKYPVFQKAKPLCYTIKEEIMADNPDFTLEQLKAALRWHVKGFKYQKKLLSKKHRYNLKEEKVSDITEREKKWAQIQSGHMQPKIKEKEPFQEQTQDVQEPSPNVVPS